MIVHRKEISGIVVLLLLVGVVSFYIGKHSDTTPLPQEKVVETEQQEASTTTVMGATSTSTSQPKVTQPVAKPAIGGTASSGVSTKGFNSYASAPYNFTIKYPPYVQMKGVFSTFHEIGNNWRLYPGQANQGKGVASFVVHSIDQGVYSTGKQSYPLYFTAEVRVGVSENVKECYTPDAGFPNQKITTVTINGVTFKKFSTFENNTPKYTQAESYRTVRNNLCYAIEQIRSGTTYRDASMQPGVTDATLMGYYSVGETIVKTFTFTK